MKKFGESIGQEIQRIKREGHREPLRTLSEMADELGVRAASLRTLIQLHEGPKPALNGRHKGGVTAAAWYKPSEIRKWWKAIKAHEAQRL